MIVPEPKDLVKDELFLTWFYQTSDSVFICRNTGKEILLTTYNQPAENWVDEFFMHGKDGFVCKGNEFERSCENALKTQKKCLFRFLLKIKGF